MILQILQDGLFSAIAAIGFAAISRPPKGAYIYCALIAAAGHSLRYALLTPPTGLHIITATLLASLLIGTLAVLVSPLSKIPAETYLFPSLLPMIPGIYAYKTVVAFTLCIFSDGEATFIHSLYLFMFNGITCCCILLSMVVGAVSPIFILKRISYEATR